MASLKEKYDKQISKELMKKLGCKNPMQIPHLVKIVINRGISEGAANPKAAEASAEEVAKITGQRPVLTRAKKAISNFKIKKNDLVGCKVTLRGGRMYEFIDKFINLCLPKIRDFRGVSPKSFDGRGGYALGIKEQLIFPEIDYEKVDKVRGMDIVIETSAKSAAETRALLECLGVPFRKEG